MRSSLIDPTGWNIRNKEVFRSLREQDGEFMLNMMSDHINRHAEYHEVEASFGRFLADAEWSDEFACLPPAWSTKRKMLHPMKAAMRSNKFASYLPGFSIMVPRHEWVKMRLILGTPDPSGFEVFRHVQEKVEKQELEMQHNLRKGDGPQVCLFSSAEIAAFQQEQKWRRQQGE